MKGIILIKDPALLKVISEAYPDWLVCLSNETEKAVEFYPSPKE